MKVNILRLATEDQIRVTKQKLNETFRLLRKAGLVARQNFSCCGGCAGAEIHDYMVKKFKEDKEFSGAVYYHRQAEDRRKDGHDFYIQYGGTLGNVDVSHDGNGLSSTDVALKILNCADRAGLVVQWDGDIDRGVKVLQQSTYRRHCI